MLILSRVKELAKQQHISISGINAEYGEEPGYLNKVAAGRRTISSERLDIIAKALHTTIEYITGESDDPEPKNPVRYYDKVPVLSEVAGGIPIQAMDIFDPQDPDSWEEIEKNAKRGGEYFGLKIHGNSMYPRIMDGDIVIVRKQETVDDGQTAIVTVNGENGTCKKIKYRPDGVMLISTNPEVEPLFFTHKEVRDLPVRIIGRVVKVHGDI